MTNQKEKEFQKIKSKNMREILIKDKKMDMEYVEVKTKRKVTVMKDIGYKIKNKEMEYIDILMEISMKEVGRKI